MFSLFRYLRGYRKELFLGPFFKLVEAVFELIIPLIMADIIDTGIARGDTDYVYRMGGLMIALAAAGLASALICQYFAAKTSQGFGTVLRSEMFAHIHAMSQAEIDRFGVPSLVTRLTNDVNQLQQAVAMLIRLAIRAPFLVIGAIVMALIIDPYMSLIFIAAAIVIALVLYAIMTRTVPFYRVAQKLLDNVSLLTRETLSGTRVIRAFSKQQTEEEQFEQASEELRQTLVRVGRISALLNPMTFAIVNLGIIAILYFGGLNVEGGLLAQGDIFALVQYMNQIMLALVVVANLVILFTRAGASATRIKAVLDAKPSITGGSGEGHPEVPTAVQFENVCFAYGDGSGRAEKYALRNINLKFERGQTIGIIGGTGSGKSTLVDLIARFYDATEGAVYVDGENVKDYRLDVLRSRIGIVPQHAQLFAGTIRQNMRWGDPNASDEEIRRALSVAQADFVFDHPDGLDRYVEQDGRNLSGGQRQRLTIARALVGDPQILILDDSASALDFATDAALRKALAAYGGGHITTIMVSQRASTLRSADQIVVMDEGAVSGVGTHDELFETNNVYREICLSQLTEKEAA
ncbi:MAG: ABC transporter ATP-binding protein [Clostridia bacterium]|nr:ABC transporter ATP-binding protein [Clostridia bacterium]